MCAQVIRLALPGTTEETPRPVLEDAWPVDEPAHPASDHAAHLTPRPDLLDLPELPAETWPLDESTSAPERQADHDPWELPPTGPEPGVAASLLHPMTRRRVDPILVWGSVAAAALLLAVGGYILGHAHGVSDAMEELGSPTLEVAPTQPAEPLAASTATGRELFRLCRLLDETRPTFDDPLDESTAAGRRRMEEWIAPWRAGWQGPLGEAIEALDLKMDWVCFVTGYEPGRGFVCQTRPDGGTRFRVNAYGLGARFWTGQEVVHTGDRIELQGVRKALEVGEGAALQLDTRCEATMVLDRSDLARLAR